MAKLTYEEAKDAIAKKNGFDTWDTFVFEDPYKALRDGSVEKEAYELGCKSWANEAVKEDRNKIIEANPTNIYENGLGDVYSCINMIKLNKIPLPYADHNKS